MHAAVRDGTLSLMLLPKEGEVSCEVGTPMSPIRMSPIRIVPSSSGCREHLS